MPEREMAAGLAVFNEPLGFEETHEVGGGALGHPGH
jgi:hypothetical protein